MMKTTLKISMAALVLLFSVTGAMAQRPRQAKMTAEQRAEKMTQRMTEQLSLTDDQAKQIEQICLKNFDQMKKSDEDRSQRMQKMDDQIKQVLTAEQRETWEKKQAEMRERMKQRAHASRGERGMGPGMAPEAEPME